MAHTRYNKARERRESQRTRHIDRGDNTKESRPQAVSRVGRNAKEPVVNKEVEVQVLERDRDVQCICIEEGDTIANETVEKLHDRETTYESSNKPRRRVLGVRQENRLGLFSIGHRKAVASINL